MRTKKPITRARFVLCGWNVRLDIVKPFYQSLVEKRIIVYTPQKRQILDFFYDAFGFFKSC
jgi:hypothetical protein